MKNQNNQTPSERVATLLNETVELLIRSESAPDSPHETVTTRHADRLLSEAIIPIPGFGDANESGRARILIRIGVGASSWVGSFESGTKPMSTIFMMPDGKHLFVSAGGSGYILEEKSRRLVERTGTEVVASSAIRR